TELVHGRPLVIHHGTEAGEAVNFYINDMHTWSLGIDEVRVITRDDATAAIAAIEDALEYALEEATYVGSYSSRLGLTEENLVTANENTQSGESTIRDADMAKTMLEYTKNSILSQASQSMLAQANQNLSGVLSLLQ
ncbi:MAG: flagellin, partial [Selenomonadaceae bacterium]|nr:flagellin [Selenomonadaceae bacterium]